MPVPASTLPLPADDTPSYLDRVRWIEVTNTEATAAPGGALLRTTGGEDDGTISVAKPDADGQSHLMVAHPAGIPAGGVGLATYTDLVPAAYDTGDGTPAVGETWGSAAGEWKLRLDNAGYRVTSDPVSSNGLNLVEVQRDATGTAAAGSFLALLIAKDAGPPVRYQYRTVTTPNDAGDAAANSTYDMVLGGTTGYAFEIDNRECVVVADPGAGTYTADPWLVAIVRVYTIGADKYFQIDQTAQDDKPGLVSPVPGGQQWARRKASRWYTHPTFRFADPAYTSAQHVDLDGDYFGFMEDDGLVNVDGAISPAPTLTQMGILRYTGTSFELAELTDRETHSRLPLWHLLSLSPVAVPTWRESGPGLHSEEGTDGDETTGHHTFALPGVVAVTDGTVADGRYTTGAGVSAKGPTRFRSDAGANERDTGPALVCGIDSGAGGEEAHTITFAASRDTWDQTAGDNEPPKLAFVPTSGLAYVPTYQCTTHFILRRGDNQADTAQDLAFCVVRYDTDTNTEVTLVGADDDAVIDVPLSPTTYARHKLFFRGGLYIWKKATTETGTPVPPPIGGP